MKDNVCSAQTPVISFDDLFFYLSEVFGHTQKFLFLILKVLFLRKQVKHHNVFIYHFKHKSASVNQTLVKADFFRKIDLKVLFFFNTEYELNFF